MGFRHVLLLNYPLLVFNYFQKWIYGLAFLNILQYFIRVTVMKGITSMIVLDRGKHLNAI
jgi:hypothetical protein